MNFLLFLLLLVFLYKLFELFDVKESFYGNCIKSVHPTLTLTHEKVKDIIYDTNGNIRNNTDINNDLIASFNTDMNYSEFSDNFLKDPFSTDYKYMDETNCDLKYLEYDS